MIKKTLILFFLLIFTTTIFAKEKLIVGTYDSFASEWGPGPEIEKLFEETCECDLEYLTTSQAGTLLGKIFMKDKDIILGATYDSNKFSDFYTFRAYDYGYYAFIYNSNSLNDPPKTFEELINRDDLKVVVQDPRTSPVGMGLLVWISRVFNKNKEETIRKLNEQIVTYTPGWSEAYGMFLDKKADLVLSYSTSPFYHQEYENNYNYKALIFPEGHVKEKEYVIIPKDSNQKIIAKNFISFLSTEKIQKIIATKNIMYPILDSATPSKMKDLPKPNDVIGTSTKEELIPLWLNVTSQ
jgi:thiamine transport system substrate-binding protein